MQHHEGTCTTQHCGISAGSKYPDKKIKAEYCWLESVRTIIALASDDEENSMNQSVDNMSWAANHASHQPAGRNVICSSALLPLFHDSAHTVAMVKHSMYVVRKAVQHLNTGPDVSSNS